MRQESIVALSAADDVTRTGGKIDASQLVNMSFHSYCSDTDAAGSVKIQASNDPVGSGALRQQFTPSHWVDIPNATATITAGSATFISLTGVAVGWVRVIFTQTNAGTGTIVVNLNAVGV